MTTYYAHGKFFDDEDEFRKFLSEWPEMPFDLDVFKRDMEMRIRYLELNEGKLTNIQAYKILRLSTDWASWTIRVDTYKGNL